MALLGNPACETPAFPVPMRRYGIRYWTPQELGTSLMTLAPFTEQSTPIINVAGLTTFMGMIDFLVFVPFFSLLDIQIDHFDPITEALIGTTELFSTADPADTNFTFGNAGQGMGFTPPSDPGIVYWLIKITFFNAGPNVDTYNFRLFGSGK